MLVENVNREDNVKEVEEHKSSKASSTANLLLAATTALYCRELKEGKHSDSVAELLSSNER